MKNIKYVCNDCYAEYSVQYDFYRFVDPSNCPFCGGEEIETEHIFTNATEGAPDER